MSELSATTTSAECRGPSPRSRTTPQPSRQPHGPRQLPWLHGRPVPSTPAPAVSHRAGNPPSLSTAQMIYRTSTAPGSSPTSLTNSSPPKIPSPRPAPTPLRPRRHSHQRPERQTTRTPPDVIRGGRVVWRGGPPNPQWAGFEALEVWNPSTHLGPHFSPHLGTRRTDRHRPDPPPAEGGARSCRRRRTWRSPNRTIPPPQRSPTSPPSRRPAA